MGVVVKPPTEIEVPKDLKCTITKDKKEVAANDDARMARAFDIDMDCYSELCSKNFLELDKNLELKKYKLMLHYGVNPKEITPKFVTIFDKEKPRSVWYYTVSTIPNKMTTHKAILEWCNKSALKIGSIIDQWCCSKSIIMCVLAIDRLNDVMLPKILDEATTTAKILNFTESILFLLGW